MQHYVYGAFGNLDNVLDENGAIVTAAPPVAPYFTYAGRELDQESGLYNNIARYYDSSIGRFIQTDPHPGKLLSPLSFLSKYSYTENNPINYTDPTGRLKFRNVVALWITFNISFAIGFGAGLLLGRKRHIIPSLFMIFS